MFSVIDVPGTNPVWDRGTMLFWNFRKRFLWSRVRILAMVLSRTNGR